MASFEMSTPGYAAKERKSGATFDNDNGGSERRGGMGGDIDIVKSDCNGNMMMNNNLPFSTGNNLNITSALQDSPESRENAEILTAKGPERAVLFRSSSSNSCSSTCSSELLSSTQEEGGDGEVTKEGSGVSEDDATYIINGKCIMAEKHSLFFLLPNSFPRRFAVSVCSNKSFQAFILFIIIVNSICTALIDYQNTDIYGNPSPSGSWRNTLANVSNNACAIIFLVECALKIIAFGFFGSHGSYLSNPWNWFDFLVVIMGTLAVSGAITSSSYGGGVAVVRTFRAIRPLRAIKEIPSLKRIVNSILLSIPNLGTVFIFLSFLFTLYGIIGVQIFSGNYYHSRCRATPFPVLTSYVPYSGMDYNNYRCINEPTFNLPAEQPKWNKQSSPWSTPRDCYWPLATRFIGLFGRNSSNLNTITPPYQLLYYETRASDATDAVRLCAYDSNIKGKSRCIHDDDSVDSFFWSWCGSSYDALGNNRFINNKLAQQDIHIPDFFYGIINFDDFGAAMINIFQSMTLEGWTANMNLLVDAYSTDAGPVYYVSIVIFGYCFVLQLVLAVIQDTYEKQSQQLHKEQQKQQQQKQQQSETLQVDDFDFKDNQEERSDATREGAREEGVFSDKSDSSSWQNSMPGSPVSTSSSPISTPAKSNNNRNFIRNNTRNNSFNSDSNTSEDLMTEQKQLDLPIRLSSSICGLSECRRIFLKGDEERSFESIEDDENKATSENYLSKTLTSISSSSFFLALSSAKGYVCDLFPDTNHPMRRSCREVVKSKTFVYVSAFFIFANCLLLAMDHYPSTNEFVDVVDVISAIFTIFFSIELALKLVSEGFLYFGKLKISLFNIFDAFVIIACVVELAVSPPVYFGGRRAISSQGNSNVILSIFRCFRLFRVIKLAIKFENVKRLLLLAVTSFLELRGFMVLLLMFQFIAAVLGMQIFANRFRFDSDGIFVPYFTAGLVNEPWKSAAEVSRYNFDDFHSAFASTFQIITTENWNSIMIDAMRSTGPIAVLFPFAVICIGTYILMNLFLAILLGPFFNRLENDGGSVDKHSAQMAEMVLEKRRKEARRSDKIKKMNEKSAESCNFFSQLRLQCIKIASSQWFDNFILLIIFISCITLALDSPLLDPKSDEHKALVVIDVVMTTIFSIECAVKIIAYGFLFDQDTYLRSHWNRLDFVVVVISLVSIFNPANKSLKIFKAFRALRVLRPLRVIKRAKGLKIIVNSLIQAIPDLLNVLMVFLTVILVCAIIFVNYLKGDLRSCQGSMFDDQIASSPYYLSLLENPPVWDTMSTQQKELFGPMSPFSTAANYMGSPCDISNNNCASWYAAPLPTCTTLSGLVSSSNSNMASVKLTSKDVCLCWGADWLQTVPQIMDNVPRAVLNLLQISTSEGWVDLMYAAVDSAGINNQPIKNNRIIFIYAFIVFMIVCGYYGLGLFIGVLVDNFFKQKEILVKAGLSGSGSLFMTDTQLEWVKTQEVIHRFTPLRAYVHPKAKWRVVIFNAIFHPAFEVFIFVSIFANTIVLALTYFGSDSVWTDSLSTANTVFSFIFGIEALFKICALGFAYFHGFWNLFDFSVVLATVAGLVLSLGFGEGSFMLITLVRVFRVFRVVRLVRGFPATKRLLDTMVLTIPAIVNILGLLLLVIYIFSVLGVQLFAFVHYNGTFDQHTNFRTFSGAMLTLVRFVTGEAWGQFMYDFSTKTEGCTEQPSFNENSCPAIYYNNVNYYSSSADVYSQLTFNSFPASSSPSSSLFANYNISHTNVPCQPLNGCGSLLIYPFMYIYILLTTICLFNLFVAAIIEGFQSASFTDCKFINPAQSDMIITHWSKFDHNATYYISMNQLAEFLRTLDKPFGFGEKKEEKDKDSKERDSNLPPPVSIRVIHKRIRDLKLDLALRNNGDNHEPMVHFRDVLMGLSTLQLEANDREEISGLYQTVGKSMARRKTVLDTLVRGLNGLSEIKVGQIKTMFNKGELGNAPKNLRKKQFNRGLSRSVSFYKTNDFFAARIIQNACRRYLKAKRSAKAANESGKSQPSIKDNNIDVVKDSKGANQGVSSTEDDFRAGSSSSIKPEKSSSNDSSSGSSYSKESNIRSSSSAGGGTDSGSGSGSSSGVDQSASSVEVLKVDTSSTTSSNTATTVAMLIAVLALVFVAILYRKADDKK